MQSWWSVLVLLLFQTSAQESNYYIVDGVRITSLAVQAILLPLDGMLSVQCLNPTLGGLFEGERLVLIVGDNVVREVSGSSDECGGANDVTFYLGEEDFPKTESADMKFIIYDADNETLATSHVLVEPLPAWWTMYHGPIKTICRSQDDLTNLGMAELKQRLRWARFGFGESEKNKFVQKKPDLSAESLASAQINLAGIEEPRATHPFFTLAVDSPLNGSRLQCSARCPNLLCKPDIKITLNTHGQPEVMQFRAWVDDLLVAQHTDVHQDGVWELGPRLTNWTLTAGPHTLLVVASHSQKEYVVRNTFFVDVLHTATPGPPHKVAITYASEQMRHSARNMAQTAFMPGRLDEVRIYRQSDLPAWLYEFPSVICEPGRGAGFWLWKFWLILKALKDMEHGDVLFWLDAGITVVDSVEPLIDLLDTSPVDVVAWDQPYKEGHFTKRDAFVLMDVDLPEYVEAWQKYSGMVLFRKSPRSVKFVEDCFRYNKDARIVTDAPNVMGLPNYPGFRAHRHDQSILSLLAHKSRMPTYHPPTDEFNTAERLPGAIGHYGVIFQCHRKRHLLWREELTVKPLQRPDALAFY